MREIKFRGQRVDNKEWVYGHYVMFLEGMRKNHCIISENKDAKGILDSTQIKYYVIFETVGQFTGHKDKQNKKIYEGDIVSHGAKHILVEMLEGYWSITPFKSDTCLEILGNKFKNPELLK